MILAIRALLTSIWGRIGGWLLLAAGAFAWLKLRDRHSRQEGAAEATAAVTARNAEVNRQQAEVVRPKQYQDLTARLREKRE